MKYEDDAIKAMNRFAETMKVEIGEATEAEKSCRVLKNVTFTAPLAGHIVTSTQVFFTLDGRGIPGMKCDACGGGDHIFRGYIRVAEEEKTALICPLCIRKLNAMLSPEGT